jgi:spermidine synthase
MSGVAVIVMEYAAVAFLPTAASFFSIMSGPLIFGLVLFFIPAFLLGVVSPYIIKLQSLYAPKDTTGSVAGTTFFFGTMGSIAGSISSGFALIPFLGIKASMLGTGFVLIFVGLIGDYLLTLLSSQRLSLFVHIARNRVWLLTVLLLSLVFLALIKSEKRAWPHTVLYDEDALYSHILVYEVPLQSERIRFLRNDSNYSSATSLDSHDLVFGYTQFAEFYRTLKPDTEQFLLIGGGAYSIPRTLVERDPNIKVDVVEIEPRLFSLAQEYFGLDDLSRIQNFAMDGRVFLRENETRYDVIYGDAFNTDLGIPPHLTTIEFFQEAKARLVNDGILMLNVIGIIDSSPPNLTGSLLRTLEAVFPQVSVFALKPDTPHLKQNIMFIARNGHLPIDLSGLTIQPDRGKILSVDDMEIWQSAFDTRDQLILTDDRAPVELLLLKQL